MFVYGGPRVNSTRCLFPLQLWSHSVRLAASVGFKGVGNAMRLERIKKVSRSARWWTVKGEFTPTPSEWLLRSKRNRLSVIELVGVAAEHGAAAAKLT